MRAQKYGRIVMTTSSSGLYGNFGQANYGAAKMALVGLMQTLALEGAKDGIRVNCLAPTAATRMTEGLLPPRCWRADPRVGDAGLLHLVSEDAPTRAILCAGAGTFERAHVTLTQGVHEQVQQRQRQLVDAHVVVFPVGAGACSGRASPLRPAAGRGSCHLAPAVHLCRAGRSRCLPIRWSAPAGGAR
jgi:hypothetical protein